MISSSCVSPVSSSVVSRLAAETHVSQLFVLLSTMDAEAMNTDPVIMDKDLPLPLQNSYAAKKTVAQGMMDVALFMANANQMRFVIEYCSSTGTYTFVMALIIASLLLQVSEFSTIYNTVVPRES